MILFKRRQTPSVDSDAGTLALPSKTRSPLRAAGTVLSWLGIAATVAAVLAVIGVMVVPKVLGWHGVVVLSGSMEPALQTGGVAFFERATAKDIAVGDVMTFKPSRIRRTLVTHRVVEVIDDPIAGRSFRTKGDANSDPDAQLVNASEVIGEVRFHVPYMGRVIEKLHNRNNYYVIIGIPAVLLILNELVELRKEYKNHRGQRHEDEQAGAEPMPSNAEGASS